MLGIENHRFLGIIIFRFQPEIGILPEIVVKSLAGLLVAIKNMDIHLLRGTDPIWSGSPVTPQLGVFPFHPGKGIFRHYP